MPSPSDPAVVVRRFLDALTAKDADTASALVSDDIAWHNSGLPTIRGRKRFEAALKSMSGPSFSVEIRIHHLAADGDIVLTERTDVLGVGPVATAFWVCGRFEVHDGRITVWDDKYSLGDVLRGSAVGAFRALAGVVRR